MHKELEEKLFKRVPTLFNLSGDALTPFRFQCSDGWFNILWGLCADLEPMVMEFENETGERFEVVQVEAKLGTLRFYVSQHTEAIDGRIAEAQEKSSRTCEVCGQPGKWLESGYSIRVVCDTHDHTLVEH
jgi:hypothetical protein